MLKRNYIPKGSLPLLLSRAGHPPLKFLCISLENTYNCRKVTSVPRTLPTSPRRPLKTLYVYFTRNNVIHDWGHTRAEVSSESSITILVGYVNEEVGHVSCPSLWPSVVGTGVSNDFRSTSTGSSLKVRTRKFVTGVDFIRVLSRRKPLFSHHSRRRRGGRDGGGGRVNIHWDYKCTVVCKSFIIRTYEFQLVLPAVGWTFPSLKGSNFGLVLSLETLRNPD